MASFEVDYSTLDHNPVLKRRTAIKDIEKYLGKPAFKKLCDVIEKEGAEITRGSVVMSLAMFHGVTGYPGHALCDMLGVKEDPVAPEKEVASNQGDSAS